MTTTNKKRALKNAIRFFKEESPVEVAEAQLRLACDAVNKDLGDTENLLMTSKRKVQRHAGFTTELRRIQESGYEFTDLDFGETVTSYLDEVVYAASQATKVAMISVRVYMVGDEQRFDCVKFRECQDRYAVSYIGDDLGGTKTYIEAELPEFIPRKISVLMMGEEGSFVSNVGYKVDEELYYVIED